MVLKLVLLRLINLRFSCIKTLRVNQDEAYPGVSGAVVTISDNATPVNHPLR